MVRAYPAGSTVLSCVAADSRGVHRAVLHDIPPSTVRPTSQTAPIGIKKILKRRPGDLRSIISTLYTAVAKQFHAEKMLLLSTLLISVRCRSVTVRLYKIARRGLQQHDSGLYSTFCIVPSQLFISNIKPCSGHSPDQRQILLFGALLACSSKQRTNSSDNHQKIVT